MIALSEKINSINVPWDVTTEPCSWEGVKFNSDNSSVLEISLSGYSLSSSNFVPLVCKIDSLQAFDVSNNLLSEIPDLFMTSCGGIQGLKLLNFSRSRLVGSLPSFVGFPGLEFLDLSYNALSGNVNSELEGLELALSANRFEDKIPEEILGYLNLTLIDLSQGSIPNRIGNLSKLEVLDLSHNNLTGAIPEGLSNISTLSRFAANQNGFSGTVPSGITKFLRHLDLSFNSLTGSIPSAVLSASNLQTVDLSSNLLEGSIPAKISSSLVRLRLGGNSLDGQISSANFLTPNKLAYLELDNNKLSGSIPPEFGSFQSLALLNLAQNRLMGPLPPELGNLSQLQVLKLQSNNLAGEIPSQITQLQKLSTLNISSNSLSGPIPSSISSLQYLVNLNLQDNGLTGSIPITIGSMNSPLELQLGKNQLSGYIPNMPPNLQIALNLSHNHFEGPIQKTLSGFDALEVLDLSYNNFSGEIRTFLAEMGSLTQVSLGVIPEFHSWVMVDTKGNKDLINTTTLKPSSKSGKGNKVAALILALTVPPISIVAGTIIAMLILWHYRGKNITQGNLLTANEIHRSDIKLTNVMEAVGYPSNIVLIMRFSSYCKAIMPSGSIYFVKKLNLSDKMFQLACRDRFRNEFEFFRRLSNSNVMTPLAYVLTANNALLLYEFAPKGTLFDALHKSSGSVMDWACRYSVAVGVAQCLAFLHGIASGPVLLLDLSSKSIFLKSLKEPLIGDIELYKLIGPSESRGNHTTIAGSVGYIPPEFTYTLRITTAANTYSFGVVLLELLTEKPAVSAGLELAKWVSSNSVQQDKWDDMLDFSVSRTSPAERSQMLAVMKIALGCVSVSPDVRPKMKSVLHMLLDAAPSSD
ncbi:hypothetical protein TIFTF001_021117 [Ficus carica]|uniref:Protein kinase domain-containing protein n=1 Tax=Ficus carica TaxID=3494 RepID=A0AA88DAF4_FICCA|nr:hypothetical protein TIFTF001_021117 [Ficus carica]